METEKFLSGNISGTGGKRRRGGEGEEGGGRRRREGGCVIGQTSGCVDLFT